MQNSMQRGELHHLLSAEGQIEISKVTGVCTLNNTLEESKEGKLYPKIKETFPKVKTFSLNTYSL